MMETVQFRQRKRKWEVEVDVEVGGHGGGGAGPATQLDSSQTTLRYESRRHPVVYPMIREGLGLVLVGSIHQLAATISQFAVRCSAVQHQSWVSEVGNFSLREHCALQHLPSTHAHTHANARGARLQVACLLQWLVAAASGWGLPLQRAAAILASDTALVHILRRGS